MRRRAGGTPVTAKERARCAPSSPSDDEATRERFEFVRSTVERLYGPIPERGIAERVDSLLDRANIAVRAGDTAEAVDELRRAIKFVGDLAHPERDRW